MKNLIKRIITLPIRLVKGLFRSIDRVGANILEVFLQKMSFNKRIQLAQIFGIAFMFVGINNILKMLDGYETLQYSEVFVTIVASMIVFAIGWSIIKKAYLAKEDYKRRIAKLRESRRMKNIVYTEPKEKDDGLVIGFQ